MEAKIQIPSEFKELFNPKWRNIVYYGGRGGLKSHSVARALLIRGEKERLRILCTRELQRSIKDSVHKLLSDLIYQYELNNYEVLKESIKNKDTGSEFIFRGVRNNTNEIKSTEGIDVCWCEEAHAMSEESIDILTPTIRKEGSQIIWTFNRMTELDPVFVKFVLHKKDDTYVSKINYEVAERLGWFPDVLKKEMERDKDDPDLFAHKWLGEPLGQGEFSVISRSAVIEATQRTIEADGGIVVGCDVARFGGDRTVMAKRKGMKTLDWKQYNKLSTVQVCDLLEEFIRLDLEEILKQKEKPDLTFNEIKREIPIRIDDTGVGGGVTDEMMKRGYQVIPINFGGRAKDPNKYPNLISEAWFEFKDNIGQMELPNENDLILELSTRQWKHNNKEQRQIESKESYKKRGFRSPDIADAFIICFYNVSNFNIETDFSFA